MNNLNLTKFEEEEKRKNKTWKTFLKIYLVLAILFLVMFTMGSTITILQVYIPAISSSFIMSEGQLAIIFTIYNISTAIFSLTTGPFIEQFGYKVMIFIGMFIFFVGTLLSSIAINFLMISMALAIAGIGSAFFGPATVAYAGEYFPKNKISSAIGLIMSSFFIATIVAVPINSYVADLLNWKWGVGIMAIFSFLVFVLILLFIPSSKKIRKSKIEFLNNNKEKSDGIKVNNEKALNYFDRIKLVLKNKYAVGTFFITLFQRGGLFAMTTLLSTWVQQKFNLGETEVGLILMGSGIAALVSNTFFSWIADKKIGKRIVILLGTSLTAIWIGIFPLISFNIPLAIFGFILANFFGGMTMGSFNAYVTEVSPISKGIAVALNNFFGQMSQAIAVAIIARIIYEKTQDYVYCGYAAMGFYIICVILMLIYIKPKKIEELALQNVTQ